MRMKLLYGVPHQLYGDKIDVTTYGDTHRKYLISGRGFDSIVLDEREL